MSSFFTLNAADIVAHNREDEASAQKKQKMLDRKLMNQEVVWVKSLLHPAMEQQFVRFDLHQIINHGPDFIICQFVCEHGAIEGCTQLLGYFSVWWWTRIFSKLEFSTIAALSDAFPCLKRIRRHEDWVFHADSFFLLYEPKLLRDEAVPERVLVTSSRFLIIE